ncbi:MAG: thiamine-phosphate kinase [Pseudomonadota bacterium]
MESGTEGEFDLIARFFSGLDRGFAVSLGNGDDAAVLEPPEGEQIVTSTDTMVCGVHFPTGADAHLIAYRAVAAATSDLAAMGATPLACLLSLVIDKADSRWLDDFRQGLSRAVNAFAIPLVGGDLARGPLTITIQVLGSVPRGAGLTRGGAGVGDLLCVSGTLGGAAAGLAVCQGKLELPANAADAVLDRFWKPRPALALGAALRGVASAAIDISDGLLSDAGHLASASGLAVKVRSDLVPLLPELRDYVPREQALLWGLTGGEDFELCFALPAGMPVPAGCVTVGQFQEGKGVSCDMAIDQIGYRHF